MPRDVYEDELIDAVHNIFGENVICTVAPSARCRGGIRLAVHTDAFAFDIQGLDCSHLLHQVTAMGKTIIEKANA